MSVPRRREEPRDGAGRTALEEGPRQTPRAPERLEGPGSGRSARVVRAGRSPLCPRPRRRRLEGPAEPCVPRPLGCDDVLRRRTPLQERCRSKGRRAPARGGLREPPSCYLHRCDGRSPVERLVVQTRGKPPDPLHRWERDGKRCKLPPQTSRYQGECPVVSTVSRVSGLSSPKRRKPPRV